MLEGSSPKKLDTSLVVIMVGVRGQLPQLYVACSHHGVVQRQLPKQLDTSLVVIMVGVIEGSSQTAGYVACSHHGWCRRGQLPKQLDTSLVVIMVGVIDGSSPNSWIRRL